MFEEHTLLLNMNIKMQDINVILTNTSSDRENYIKTIINI